MKIPPSTIIWLNKFVKNDMDKNCPYPFHGADYADRPEKSRIRQSFSDFKANSLDYFIRLTPRSSKSSINSCNAESFLGEFNISPKSKRNIKRHKKRLQKKFRKDLREFDGDLQGFDNISISSNTPTKLTLTRRLFHRGTKKMQQELYEQRVEVKKNQQESLLAEALRIRTRRIHKLIELEKPTERYYTICREASTRAKEELRELAPGIVSIINQLKKTKSKSLKKPCRSSIHSSPPKTPSISGKSHHGAETGNKDAEPFKRLMPSTSSSTRELPPLIFHKKNLTLQTSPVAGQLEKIPSQIPASDVNSKPHHGAETRNNKRESSQSLKPLRSNSTLSNAPTLRNDNCNLLENNLSLGAGQVEQTSSVRPAKKIKRIPVLEAVDKRESSPVVKQVEQTPSVRPAKKIKRKAVAVTEPENRKPSQVTVHEPESSANYKRSSFSSTADTILPLPRSNSSSSSRTAASSGSIKRELSPVTLNEPGSPASNSRSSLSSASDVIFSLPNSSRSSSLSSVSLDTSRTRKHYPQSVIVDSLDHPWTSSENSVDLFRKSSTASTQSRKHYPQSVTVSIYDHPLMSSKDAETLPVRKSSTASTQSRKHYPQSVTVDSLDNPLMSSENSVDSVRKSSTKSTRSQSDSKRQRSKPIGAFNEQLKSLKEPVSTPVRKSSTRSAPVQPLFKVSDFPGNRHASPYSPWSTF